MKHNANCIMFSAGSLGAVSHKFLEILLQKFCDCSVIPLVLKILGQVCKSPSNLCLIHYLPCAYYFS